MPRPRSPGPFLAALSCLAVGCGGPALPDPRKAAQAYLEFLYSPEGQELCARHSYRPRDKAVAAKYAAQFPPINLVRIDDEMFGGWAKAQKKHFDDGGLFDQIYQPGS